MKNADSISNLDKYSKVFPMSIALFLSQYSQGQDLSQKELEYMKQQTKIVEMIRAHTNWNVDSLVESHKDEFGIQIVKPENNKEEDPAFFTEKELYTFHIDLTEGSYPLLTRHNIFEELKSASTFNTIEGISIYIHRRNFIVSELYDSDYNITQKAIDTYMVPEIHRAIINETSEEKREKLISYILENTTFSDRASFVNCSPNGVQQCRVYCPKSTSQEKPEKKSLFQRLRSSL